MLGLLVACTGAPAEDSDKAVVEPETGELDTDQASGAWAEVSGAPADALGNAVEAAGDLDGDGDDDLLAAAYLGNRVCALLGPLPTGPSTLDSLPTACFVGEVDTDYAGYGMAAAGDLTGDNVGDVLVGSIGNADAGANAGKGYLIAGPIAAGSASLGDAAISSWSGESAGDYAGITVTPGGDLTGDGVADLLVGASGYDGEGGGGGRAYVLAGPFSPGNSRLGEAYASVTGLGVPADAPPPPPHGAFGIGDFVGDALVGGFDYDGDGVHDLAVGASGDPTLGLNSGKVAVFFGPVGSGAALVTDADVSLLGEAEFSYTGSPLRGAPDLTGDGRDDLLVAADTLGPGVVYLTSPALGQTAVVEATTRFEGAVDGDLFGSALSPVADLDADGALDVAIAGPASIRADRDVGGVWWFAGPFPPGVVAAADGGGIYGAIEGESFGSALDATGDLDGDTKPDLVVGARNSDANGGFSGRIYVFGL